MARGELLRKLIASHRRGNEEEFHAAALQIVAEEQKKKNHQLAKELLRILENSGSAPSTPSSSLDSLPRDRERQVLLVDVRYPERTLNDIILGKENREVVTRILEEYSAAELLHTHGLEPLTKILFCGPPGCGKTLCAEILSSELGLPLLYTRFDSIVSSYLGETAANLRKVFDYASKGHWIVFFDEFDAIGKGRDDPHEHGELKRVVNSFLQLLDSFRSRSLVIAATNHARLLDSALWRRFDEILLFPLPSIEQIRRLIALKLRNFPNNGLNLPILAGRLRGMSYADVERICLDAVKSSIVKDTGRVNGTVFNEAIIRHKTRLRITRDALEKQSF